MKTALLIITAAGLIGGETASATDKCVTSAASSQGTASRVGQYDPIALDLNGDERAAVPGTCDHAINTKGTGTSGRTAGVELAIKTKGTSAQRGAASADHAINTKGTGAAGRTANPGPGGDCDDTDATDLRFAPRESLPVADAEQRAAPAIKCKGTGAQ